MNSDNSEYLALCKEAASGSTSGDRLKELATLNDDLAKIVANNIAALPELLHKLSFHENKVIRKVVSKNPATPLERLLYLGERYPQELLNNSVFQLLLLEDLKFVKQIPLCTLASLVYQQEVPKLLLEYAANHKDKYIAYIAKLHVTISGEILKGWHEEALHVIRHTPLKYDVLNSDDGEFDNLFFPSESLANFLEFIPSVALENLVLRSDIARNSNTATTLLKKLASDSTRWIRDGVAGNPSTSIEILELLAVDSNYMVRRKVADNLITPSEILELFAKDSSIKVRMQVGTNQKTPKTTLKILARDKESRVRMQVAGNTKTPSKQLKLLINDEDYIVRQCATKNPSIPIQKLESLAFNPDKIIRQCVAENPSSPSLKTLPNLKCHLLVE